MSYLNQAKSGLGQVPMAFLKIILRALFLLYLSAQASGTDDVGPLSEAAGCWSPLPVWKTLRIAAITGSR